MKIVVLGAGRVGSAIIRDLAVESDFEVTAVDFSRSNLDGLDKVAGVKLLEADLSSGKEVARVVSPAGLVVGAVPGSMGFRVLKTVLECGKPAVDISFFEEDPFILDDLAREKGVVAAVDCGVAPGCANIIAGYLSTILDEMDRLEYFVGGLPVVRTLPYEYKAVFSPSDVIEEYTRPARYVAGGKVKTLPALSEVELIDFGEVGTLEAFNSDGLRTLLHTLKSTDMKEKTLRYPGHVERVKLLRDTGFFGKEPIDVRGAMVRPLDLTAKLLFPMWKLCDGDEDLTVMRIKVTGKKDGHRVHYTYDLLDHYDRATGTTSMARTTGYTCTAVVRLVAGGLFSRPGIAPPELIGKEDGCYLFVMQELAKRGVVFKETVT